MIAIRTTLALAALAAVSGRFVPFQGAESELVASEYVIQFDNSAVAHQTVETLQVQSQSNILPFEIVGPWEFGSFYAIGIRGASESLARSMDALPGVSLVQANMQLHLFGETPENPQRDATWGLDRSDQNSLPLDSLYYFHDTYNGQGVDVYVLDTGINTDHEDWNGNAKFGANFANDAPAPGDCHGHGTHCAGSVAAQRHGIAKGSTVWSVKVMNCDGTGNLFSILYGYDWAIKHHENSGKAIGVVSLSLGAMYNPILDAATKTLTEANLAVVAAAGNSDADACTFSPASTEGVLTVAASTIEDEKAEFSNWGTCTDVFAPGHRITSLDHATNDGYKTFSGTSMACPHAAGGVAAVLSRPGAPSTIPELFELLLAESTKGALKGDLKGTPNQLLFTNPSLNATQARRF